MTNVEKKLNEPILEDTYPVYISYAYVADGKVVASPIEGTVQSLKRTLGAKEIRRCDIYGRGNMRGADLSGANIQDLAER